MSSVPTVKVYKDGKMMICNESDLDRFRAEGWELAAVEPPKAKQIKAEKSDK